VVKHSVATLEFRGGEDAFEDLGRLDETFVPESVSVPSSVAGLQRLARPHLSWRLVQLTGEISAEIVVVLGISRGNLGRWNGRVIGCPPWAIAHSVSPRTQNSNGGRLTL